MGALIEDQLDLLGTLRVYRDLVVLHLALVDGGTSKDPHNLLISLIYLPLGYLQIHCALVSSCQVKYQRQATQPLCVPPHQCFHLQLLRTFLDGVSYPTY